ncbi:MAG: hypothetical protein ACR2QA_15095 [Solirubrobacteraceae bacterium]
MWSRSSIPGAILVAVVIAGCGGSSAPSLSAFKRGFVTDRAQFRSLGTDVGTTLQQAPTKTDTEIATGFGALATRATQQAAQLRQLKAPAAYKPALDQLVAGFDAVASDLHMISGAGTAHNVQGAKTATATLIHDATKVKAADTSLSAKLGLPKTG